MKCECGNDKFVAHQQCYHDIIVDGNGNFESDKGIYESNSPYGPFTCTECDKEYEELKEPDTITCTGCGKSKEENGYCEVDGSPYGDCCWSEHIENCDKCKEQSEC